MKRLCEARPAVRRLALVSDTHGQLAAGLAAGIAAAEPDLIVHAGDVGGSEVLAALAAVAPVCAVAGNNDDAAHWGGDEPALLEALPHVRELGLAGGTLVVVHGHQCRAAARRHGWLRRRFAGARAIVYGHSHRRVIDDAATPVVVNPGAGGRARAFGGAGWLLLSVGDDWHFETRLTTTLRARQVRPQR